MTKKRRKFLTLAILALKKERRTIAPQASAAKFGFDWGTRAQKQYDEMTEAIEYFEGLKNPQQMDLFEESKDD